MALGIGAIFLGGVTSVWFYSTKNWKEENVRGSMRLGLEAAFDKIKADIRLSDASKILYYPSGLGGPYSAISIPATTRNANGLFTIGTTISWSKTILYYVYNNSGVYELRKTVYSSFNSSSSTRQTQLDTVVTTGTATGATTIKLLSANSITLEINSATPTFDGYSASTKLSSETDFGNARLSAGTHQIKFEIVGKNASSTGRRLGVDYLALTPSGGPQEAEVLTVSADTGQTRVTEDMSGYSTGPWGGNYQVEYQSSAVNDSITWQTYYDQWLETNFQNMTHSYTAVAGTDPYVTVADREAQGQAPAWKAETQTLDLAPTDQNVDHTTIRAILKGANISKPSHMIRIKFMAAAGSSLTVSSAYFGVRSGSTSSFTASPTPLYFNNGSVPEGGVDGVGAIGSTGPTTITIPAGQHAWSNWFEYPIPANPAQDYMVSYYTHQTSSANASTWDPGVVAENSYTADQDHAADVVHAGFVSDQRTYGVAELACWYGTGATTSQVYDTKITAPALNQISWTPTLPAGSSVSMKVRSSASSDMSGASWSAAYASSPASLSSVPNLRYLQFQATLTSASPYTSFPKVDNVKIDWPGQDALVNLSGQYTKKSNYGIFQVFIDGNALVKALTVKLSATTVYRGKSFTQSVGSEVKARNTGK